VDLVSQSRSAARVIQTGGRNLRGLSTTRPGQGEIPAVTENKVLAGNPAVKQDPLTSTIETGEERASTLRGARDVGRPAQVTEPTEFEGISGQRLAGTIGSRQAARQAAISEAETDPVSYGKAPAGSLGGPEESPFFREAPSVPRGTTADMPFEALFRNPPSTEAELRASAERATSRLGGIRARARPDPSEELSTAEREAVSLRTAQQAERVPGQLIEPTPAPVVPVLPARPPPAVARQIPKPEPEPSVPSASTPAAPRPAVQEPETIEPTPGQSLADLFPSPPRTEPETFEGRPLPAPARPAPHRS